MRAHTHTRSHVHTYIFVPYFLASFPYLLWYSLLLLPWLLPLLAFISFFFSRILFSTFTLKRFFRFAASVEVDVDVAVGIFNLYYAVIPCKLYQNSMLCWGKKKCGNSYLNTRVYVYIFSFHSNSGLDLAIYVCMNAYISVTSKANDTKLACRILRIICRYNVF